MYLKKPKSLSKYKRLKYGLATILLIVSSLFFLVMEANASALSFICSSATATGGGTSVSACSGEQAGDLLLIMCGERIGGVAPTLPTGVNAISGTSLINSGGGSSTKTGMQMGWTTASNSSSGSGTCGSGTTDVIMSVYRGQAGSPIGPNLGTESGNNSGTTVSYNSDNLSATDGSSWFVAFSLRVANNLGDTCFSTPPTGMTNRAISGYGAAHDTNGPQSSNWSLATVSGCSTSTKYTSVVLEILSAPQVTVGNFGTQVSSMAIPSTGNFTGGAFTLLRDVGSANITSIKVTENGTVNAAANLSNLFLYYKQEAACESSFPSSGTTQFNSTGGSFTLVSGTTYASTVTGTISVSTSQICIYLKVDVGSGATSGNTFEAQIANPSTDMVASVGSVSPSSAVAIAGVTTLGTPAGPTMDQVMRGGNWFNSSGTEQSLYWAQ